jgi:hypothetical protein
MLLHLQQHFLLGYKTYSGHRQRPRFRLAWGQSWGLKTVPIKNSFTQNYQS